MSFIIIANTYFIFNQNIVRTSLLSIQHFLFNPMTTGGPSSDHLSIPGSLFEEGGGGGPVGKVGASGVSRRSR